MKALWPEGFVAAAVVIVVVDGERALLTIDPELVDKDKTLSTARYGLRRGVDALASAFAEFDVAPAWLAPGSMVRGHPELFRGIPSTDELGMRGDDLERFDELDEVARDAALDRAMESFAAIGRPPSGFRLPRGDWPAGLVDALARRGISWSSSWTADDLPFTLPGAEGGSLVELPFHHVADDRAAFEWNFSPAIPAGHSRIADYERVLENWLWELESVHREGLLWVLTVHPHVIGTPGRIGLLRELLAAARGLEGLWLPSPSALASWWRSSGQTRGRSHRAQKFLELTGRSGY